MISRNLGSQFRPVKATTCFDISFLLRHFWIKKKLSSSCGDYKWWPYPTLATPLPHPCQHRNPQQKRCWCSLIFHGFHPATGTYNYISGWWYTYPSDTYESQLGWWHSQLIWTKNPNVSSHHQPNIGFMSNSRCQRVNIQASPRPQVIQVIQVTSVSAGPPSIPPKSWPRQAFIGSMAKPWENPTKYPWYSMVTRCYLHGRSYMGWIYVWLCDIIYGMADIFLSQHHELKMAYQVPRMNHDFPNSNCYSGVRYAMPHFQTHPNIVLLAKCPIISPLGTLYPYFCQLYIYIYPW